MAPKTQNPKAKGWKTNVRNLTDTTFVAWNTYIGDVTETIPPLQDRSSL